MRGTKTICLGDFITVGSTIIVMLHIISCDAATTVAPTTARNEATTILTEAPASLSVPNNAMTQRSDNNSTVNNTTAEITTPAQVTTLNDRPEETTTGHQVDKTTSQTEDDVKSEYCEWMTEQEQKFAVSFIVSGDNLTVHEWRTNEDEPFRMELAACLANFTTKNLNKDDLKYVHPSPFMPGGSDNATIQIYVFLQQQKLKSLFMNDSTGNGEDDEPLSTLLNNCTRRAIPQKYLVENPMTGLPGPDCESLFQAYLPLWIALIAAAVVCLVLSGVITWCCWKRGKSVQLKSDKRFDLPASDELRHSSDMSGEDNPALVLSLETSPSKKNPAPQPPTSTPNMTTFGKGPGDNAGVEYETGIAPYDASTNGGTANPPGEVEDTKL